jgi:hypothetical protein
MLVGSIVQLTDAQRHIRTQNASHDTRADTIQLLIETGKTLALRYGHRDSQLWVDFEALLLQAELESLSDTQLINIAPCLSAD